MVQNCKVLIQTHDLRILWSPRIGGPAERVKLLSSVSTRYWFGPSQYARDSQETFDLALPTLRYFIVGPVYRWFPGRNHWLPVMATWCMSQQHIWTAFIWTGEYDISHFTTSELSSIDFTTGEHHLWTGDFLSGLIFTSCGEIFSENGQKLQGKVS